MKREKYNDEMIEDMLANNALHAPEHITAYVMKSLPMTKTASIQMGQTIEFWPREKWLVPAFAGAAAAVIFMGGLIMALGHVMSDKVLVTFEIAAPDAKQIELVGTFNSWEPGQITLQNKNKDGHWSVTVPLQEGRHEYMFLVDGKHWMADPTATLHRPDGFGRNNSIIEI